MSLIVEVQQGKLKGIENTSVLNGQKYYSFLGIPYAKPPVGDLRFKAPEPYEKWDGIYDATHEGNSCIQKDYFITQGFLGSEDCLFINVHTPQVPADIKVPKAVLVFIHGGGFFTGSGSQKMYSADFLITQDIIMVTFNYRLHIFGYLNLGIPDCPGNAGLKDQSLALKWIKENIAKFGGDPNNITIFGESAGASSVQFQIISPLSKGLFNKAILQSGSALVPWAMTFDPKEMAEEIAERLGFQGGSAQQVLDFLKMQSSDDLTHEAMVMTEDLKKRYPGRCTSIPFSPSVETIKNGAFLPELPQKLLETTPPLPIIYGANNKEGLLLFLALTDDIITRIKDDFSLVLKNNFKIDPALLPTLSAKVKQYYFGDKEIGMETAESLTDLYTDLYFYQMYEAIDFVTKTQTPAYVYEFCYDGGFNTFKKIAMRELNVDIKGASHGDDLGYLFYPRMMPTAPPIEGDDLAVINNMITLWANFAKTGVPTETLTWAPSTSSQPRYLQIDPTLTLIDGKVFGKRLQFLKDLLGPVAKPYDIF